MFSATKKKRMWYCLKYSTMMSAMRSCPRH